MRHLVSRSANLFAAAAMAIGVQAAPARSVYAASAKPVQQYKNYVPGPRCLKMLGRDGNYTVCGTPSGGKKITKLPSKV